MRKLVTATCLALGLAAIPGIASAGPIGTNGCASDPLGFARCDIFADYDGGASSLGQADGNLGSYLLGYTFLLNVAADLTDGFQAEDVAHILVIHDSVFELFSNTIFNALFDSAFEAARDGAKIDNLDPDIGQLAGCPAVPTGVPNVAGVGYCTTADVVSIFVNWGLGGDGGLDVLNIHTALDEVIEPPTGENPIPEPGTLSLFALGGSAALASLRRRRRAANQLSI
jgi:hypothetical protein